MQPLTGVNVLDFSTLLPGPLATLILAEAGAEVIKIERPQGGDGQRTLGTPLGDTTAEFALLNRGKRSIAIDLKSADAVGRLTPLIREADVLVEQFRPGVMSRLGFGYEQVRRINSKLIYCSLTGYGQSGPKSMDAGHDLNYIAETGLLTLAADERGAPVIPPALIADIAGGAYPLVINVLLALRQRESSGEGCMLDVSMSDNLFPMSIWAQGLTEVEGRSPIAGGEWLTGGSPRYQIYRTADDRFLACAPLEQKFWKNFCDTIGLDDEYRDDVRDTKATKAAVTGIIATRTAAEWMTRFEGIDACVCIAKDLCDAMKSNHFRKRGLFDRRVGDTDASLTAAVVPVTEIFRTAAGIENFPSLGEDNDTLLGDGGRKP